jgi:hypothetical protein
LGLPARTEHTHEALRRRTGRRTELLESDGGIDEVAEHGFAGFDVTGQECIHRLRQQRFAKGGVALDPRLNRVLE